MVQCFAEFAEIVHTFVGLRLATVSAYLKEQ